jgi:hypothetical protein
MADLKVTYNDEEASFEGEINSCRIKKAKSLSLNSKSHKNNQSNMSSLQNASLNKQAMEEIKES